MRSLVTGGAGFIGSALVARLLAEGHEVVVYDNLSSGRREFLSPFEGREGFAFVLGDLLEPTLRAAMAGIDVVWHIAANPDIRYGAEKTDLDLQQGTIATYNVLAAMLQAGARRIVLASTSAVYGRPSVFPTPENHGPLLPESLYGASKLACEGLVSAFCATHGFQAWVFRFANVVGPNATHGIIPDLVAKLQRDRSALELLGDGRQRKSYVHVADCVRGMIHGWEHADAQVNVYNLGNDDDIVIRRIADIVLEEAGLGEVPVVCSGGEVGWPGDVPLMKLDCRRVRALGWEPTHTSEEAVREAARWVLDAAGMTG